ncbi:helix-turn-helix domain-containing protein [Halococcus saccharolyticus]|uniref:Bacterio-opsin activator HTH domain-containing protein n=1 Tax=Halococcus saccharolyticus DSM 5350 TaxID=1227455 RepID=M0MGC1_9EURY|nr:helix-turn-helix domain-containing protein [Halococcus saccharolyticus]EMA44782.1 bacterio-opsin activator HTH domain-containing protein [Halococcus saccharolyticus DSM 5350]
MNRDLIVEEASGTAEEWEFHLRAHDQAALSTFQEACHDKEVPIDITRVHHNPEEADGPSHRLTRKQREAVTLAFERGYFAVPREITLTELAEEIGISRQAYSRRLQRGLRNVLSEVLPSDGE